MPIQRLDFDEVSTMSEREWRRHVHGQFELQNESLGRIEGAVNFYNFGQTAGKVLAFLAMLVAAAAALYTALHGK